MVDTLLLLATTGAGLGVLHGYGTKITVFGPVLRHADFGGVEEVEGIGSTQRLNSSFFGFHVWNPTR